MAKTKTAYVCTECGQDYVKWQGQCSACGEWNTLVEQRIAPAGSQSPAAWGPTGGPATPRRLADLAAEDYPRMPLPDPELNRVLGGGLVPGSVLLLGGEPGIGKSTLLLQTALQLERTVLYVSGEESEQQIKLRADRLPGQNPHLYLLAETRVESLIPHLEQLNPGLLIVDSIQTLYTEALESAPGSVGQVRESAARLLRVAKERNLPLILVGHINKDGMIAGPKVLEHMVDVVLEFEGERHYQYRVLRAVKNRFGATPELGLFEMKNDGLHAELNPSKLMLGEDRSPEPGIAVAATVQGLRPMLVECQALVTDATYGTPQRSAVGMDLRRLNMLLAVLEKKARVRMGTKDVFVNLAGGIRLDDPGLDLAILAALLSSTLDVPLPPRTVFAAELSLTGELRQPARLEQRLAEAAKMGFEQFYTSDVQLQQQGLQLHAAARLEDVFRSLFSY